MGNDTNDNILNQLRAKAVAFDRDLAGVIEREQGSDEADALEWIQKRSQLIVSEIDEIIKRRDHADNVVIETERSEPAQGSG